MAHNSFWYDGFMDSNDAAALDLLLKSDHAELIGLSECFKITKPDDEIKSEIRAKTSLEIHYGAQRPIISQGSIAREFAFLDRDSEPETGYAWDAMYAAAKKENPLTLLCVGTMTNIALAMLRYDDFVEYIDRIVFIAGTLGIGDSTAMAENKAAMDAFAIKTVLTSGAKLLYIGIASWDSKRVTPVDMVSCALNIENLHIESANMDIETVVCDQFARTILDTRVTSKTEKNIKIFYLDDSKEYL